MKVTIKYYRLSACVTPLTIIRFFINNKRKYKRKYKRISQILRIQIILILIDILLNLPKKVGRQLDEKSVSSRRSILPRK